MHHRHVQRRSEPGYVLEVPRGQVHRPDGPIVVQGLRCGRVQRPEGTVRLRDVPGRALRLAAGTDGSVSMRRVRERAVPAGGTAQNLSFPLDEDNAIPAPRIPPITEPSLQSLSSIFSALF